MDKFYIILDQVLILLIIMVLGYALGHMKILTPAATKKLSEIVLYVTTPMTILNSFFIELNPERISGLLWTLAFSAISFGVTILLAPFLFRRYSEDDAAVMKFTMVFSNATYMGFPLMSALYGDEGVFYGSFYSVVFTVLLFSYGFILFGGKGSTKSIIKKVVTNPNLIAIYFGLAIFLLQLNVPTIFRGAITAVGQMTMPMSMLIIGGVISTAKLRSIFTDPKVYYASFVRLILIPLVGLGLVLLLRIPTLPATIVLTAMAMPAATSTTMFAEMFNKGSVLSSRVVAVSTVLCVITAPLMISLVTSVIA